MGRGPGKTGYFGGLGAGRGELGRSTGGTGENNNLPRSPGILSSISPQFAPVSESVKYNTACTVKAGCRQK